MQVNSQFARLLRKYGTHIKKCLLTKKEIKERKVNLKNKYFFAKNSSIKIKLEPLIEE